MNATPGRPRKYHINWDRINSGHTTRFTARGPYVRRTLNRIRSAAFFQSYNRAITIKTCTRGNTITIRRA